MEGRGPEEQKNPYRAPDKRGSGGKGGRSGEGRKGEGSETPLRGEEEGFILPSDRS